MVTQADIERVQEEIKPQMMVMMIIHFALMVGAGFYAAFVLLTNWQKEVYDEAAPGAIAIPIAFTAVNTVLSFIIPSFLLRGIKNNVTWTGDPANRSSNPTQKSTRSDVRIPDTPAKALMGGNMVTRIVGLAMLEGNMFLCSFLASKYSLWWLLGTGTLLLLMVLRFPWPRQIAEWVADEEELLLASRGDASQVPSP
ncbi:MAG: hypothetical protein ACK5PZ_09910 [Pirellula sp.]